MAVAHEVYANRCKCVVSSDDNRENQTYKLNGTNVDERVHAKTVYCDNTKKESDMIHVYDNKGFV